jgi:di/tricarboxylate transporter
LGKTIRDSKFRSQYNAVIIALARNGERLKGKIGDFVLRAGDTLLLEAEPDFADKQRHSRDFYLTNSLENSSPLRHEKSLLAFGILLGMILLASFDILPMFQAAILAAGLLIITRCVSASRARQAIDWSVLIAIGASFGLGKALEVTGVADSFAHQFVGVAGGNPWLSLCIIYFITMLTTEVISNNGAAVLMFPIAVATATTLGVSVTPFAIAIMMAASSAFATPIGYQTNLMVYGPGGYRFTDFTRMGLPLNLICAVITLVLIPLIWHF